MTTKEKENAYRTQNPDLCLRGRPDRVIYNALKTVGLCPVMKYPLGKWWFDFVFPEEKIVIEYDYGRSVYDVEKHEYAHLMGWRIYKITKLDFESFKDENCEDKMRIELFFDRLKKRLRKTPEESVEEYVYEENELEKSY